jgi:hypothetical protein
LKLRRIMETLARVIKSKPAVLAKIGESKYFAEQWEDLNKAMGRVLSEAYNSNGTMNDWIDACNKVKTEMDNIHALGWSVKHGDTVE